MGAYLGPNPPPPAEAWCQENDPGVPFMTGTATGKVEYPVGHPERVGAGGQKEQRPRRAQAPRGPVISPTSSDYQAFLMSKQIRQVGMFSGSVEPSSTGS